MKDPRFITVLIADDHPIVCVGLTSLINRERGLRVVAEANSWPQANRRCRASSSGIGDPGPPYAWNGSGGRNPGDREKSPETRIVVLSAFGGDEDVFKVLRAGAIGYLPKDAERESIRECISAVREDKTWIHPSSAAKLAGRIQAKDITSRESRVLRLVASGKSNKEIGAFLRVTEGTVKVHVYHLFAKLGVDGRVAATMLALQRGFVHLPLVPDSSANGLASREKDGQVENRCVFAGHPAISDLSHGCANDQNLQGSGGSGNIQSVEENIHKCGRQSVQNGSSAARRPSEGDSCTMTLMTQCEVSI